MLEVALLISDGPGRLSEMQRIGNYSALQPISEQPRGCSDCGNIAWELGLFSDSFEYYLELGRHVLRFYDKVSE